MPVGGPKEMQHIGYPFATPGIGKTHMLLELQRRFGSAKDAYAFVSLGNLTCFQSGVEQNASLSQMLATRVLYAACVSQDRTDSRWLEWAISFDYNKAFSVTDSLEIFASLDKTQPCFDKDPAFCLAIDEVRKLPSNKIE